MLEFYQMVNRNFAVAIHSGVAALILFLFSTQAFGSGQVALPLLAPQAREATAQKFVGQSLRVWQERLNLKDWDIHVDLVRPSALEPKTLGNIHWDTSTRHATIDVLSSYDYTLPLPEMLSDMELTVVHELIHLHLASLPRSDATRRNEEYVVNQISRALLNLSKH
jgi:hypothetical protein